MNREELEQVRIALTTIAEWPCSAQDDMQAANMRAIARAALSRVDAALQAGAAQPVATLWLGSTDKTPAEKFLPLPAMYDLPKGAHQLYAAPVKVEAQPQRICLNDYINAANISGADMPHTVVEKLQAAIDAAAQPQTGGSGDE
jgi:hypothetical protein